MSGGFRSWLAGVIGRLSSTPAITTNTDGITFYSNRPLSVFSSSRALVVNREPRKIEVQYSEREMINPSSNRRIQ